MPGNGVSISRLTSFPRSAPYPMPAVNHNNVVLGILEPLWKTRTGTAWRIRERLEMIIDWAKFRGHCTGENAARWKGHLAFSYSIRKRSAPSGTALSDVPEFLQKLRKHRGIVAGAPEFTVLTAGRQCETRGARWHEFNLEAGLWTIPAHRMKMRREHRVALNEPALAILREVAWLKGSEDDFVFPGQKPGRPLGQLVMKTLMPYMSYNGIATAHGFRSTFQRLGARANRLSNRGNRAGTGARHRQQGRGRLSARRSARKTPALEQGLGRFLPRSGRTFGIGSARRESCAGQGSCLGARR